MISKTNSPTKSSISSSPSNLLLEYCQKHNIRRTHQRTKIFDEIYQLSRREGVGHPSAEEVYCSIKKKLPHISLDTVYKNLTFFEKIGILSRVKSHSQLVNRYELNHEPHHHFCCEKCDRIYDISWREFDELKTPILQKIGEIHHSSVTLYGICLECNDDKK